MAKIGELIRTNKLPSLEGPDNNSNDTNIEESDDQDSVSFGDTVEDFINAVNDDQKKSEKLSEQVIKGESDNLTQAMAKAEEAELSFDLMLKIRNKLIDSYKEVKRMQI